MRQVANGSRMSSIMTLHGHLKEARNRLFIVFAVFVLFTCLAYYFHERLMTSLLAPLDGQTLSYLNPGGGFSFVFSVTMWAGLALTTPVIIYSIYKFIAPALPQKAQSRGGLIFISSYLLFAAGALFGYMYAIPGALQFLIGFGDEFVQAMLTADAYLNFVLVYTIGLGILFQIPILMMITHWITPLKPLRLLKFERYVIAIAFVAAAIITPTPDIANQVVVAAPFIGMYQVGLVGVSLSHWRHKRAERGKMKEKGNSVAAVSNVAPGTLQALKPAIVATATIQQPELSAQYRTVRAGKSLDGLSVPRSQPPRPATRQVAVPPRNSATPARTAVANSGSRPVMDILVSASSPSVLDTSP